MITGGKTGIITSTISVLREYSNRPLYSPIPYDFIRVASNSPSLFLSINQMPSLCQDCSFEFDASITPSISSASLSGRTYSLGVTVPSARRRLQTVALEDISVTLADVSCTSLTGTVDSFTCSFP